MALTDGGLSIADALALSRNDDNGMFGDGGGSWIFFLFFLMAMGGNGFGFGNGSSSGPVTSEDMQNQFNFAALERQMNEGVAATKQASYDTVTAIAEKAADNNIAIRDVAAAITQNGYFTRECCCETNRNIDGLRYDAAKNTCDIITASNMNTRDLLAAQNLNTQRILDFMTNDKIETLRSELQAAQYALSNGAQTSAIINAVRPFPMPAYITCSPYTSATACGVV